MELYVCTRADCGGLMCPVSVHWAEDSPEEDFEDDVPVVCNWCAEYAFVAMDTVQQVRQATTA